MGPVVARQSPSHQSLPSSVNPRCLRGKKKRRIDLETPESGECRLQRISYQLVQRRAVLLALLLCAGLASVIYFEVQRPMEPPVAAVAPMRRSLDGAPEQVSDHVLHDAVGRQPNRVPDVLTLR